MKKIAAFACIFLLVGCGSVLPKRGVEHNTFYSTANPKLFLKVPHDFEFIEKTEDSEYATYVGGMGGAMAGGEKYIFGSEDATIIVLIQRIRDGSWLPGIFRDVDPRLEYGNVVIKGDRYEYLVALTPPNEKEEYAIVKGFARISGSDREIITQIFYAENVVYSMDFKFRYDDWKSMGRLSPEQNQYLRDFKRRAELSLIFLDRYEVKEEKPSRSGGRSKMINAFKYLPPHPNA